MWDDSGTQGVIKHVYVNHTQVRTAARIASDAGDSVSAGQLHQGAATAIAAVPGSESATAFSDVADVLAARVRHFQSAVEQWSDDIHDAVAAYEAADTRAANGLSHTSWRVQ